MGTILMTWELGSGIGHLMRLRPIGQMLVQRGHRVIAAARDLTQVRQLLQGTGISFIPAPSMPVKRVAVSPMRGFAHILANVGFADESVLATLFAAWNTLFDCIRPDLVILDHSPSALLALHERPIPRANIGLGFFCPPPGFPLPFWLTGKEKAYAGQVVADEEALTAQVNRVLQMFHRSPMKCLGDLYKQMDETILATYEEFDHFGPRQGARYWGHWPFFPGEAPVWPTKEGPKIYGYLKPFPELEPLLQSLVRWGHPCILLGISNKLQKQCAASHIVYVSRPLNLRRVAQECDVAILNAGHGTTVSMLLAGKPCLLLPLFTEQLLFSQRVQKINAGRIAEGKGEQIGELLAEMIKDDSYSAGAKKFAKKYAAFRPGEQLPEVVERLERLIQRRR